jgi:hypothetical protein
MSSIWQKMQDDELPNKLQFQLANKQKTVVHPYLLGDSAYPIRVELLKCYTAKGTSTKERNSFDSSWRSERTRIENAFGILKNKWSILKNLNCDLKYAPTIITACCILHNFCIGIGDVGSHDLIDDKPNSLKPDSGLPTPAEEQSKKMGKREREALFQEWSRKYYASK